MGETVVLNGVFQRPDNMIPVSYTHLRNPDKLDRTIAVLLHPEYLGIHPEAAVFPSRRGEGWKIGGT